MQQWITKRQTRFDQSIMFGGLCKLAVQAGLLLTTQGMDIYNENFEVGSNVLSRGRTFTAIAWISFPSLPPNFFVKEAVFSLAAAVGKPLQVDLATKNQTRPSCAKVKVEVDLLREFPKLINVGMRKKSGEVCEKWIRIKYDYVPKYCKSCKIQGHNEAECFVVHSALYPKKDKEK
ncbi:hypothetical protein KY289_036555 [Solanum tuberosum]|nr:hypothetical protein KY289_036555 [Solanum tuberosum]